MTKRQSVLVLTTTLSASFAKLLFLFLVFCVICSSLVFFFPCTPLFPFCKWVGNKLLLLLLLLSTWWQPSQSKRVKTHPKRMKNIHKYLLFIPGNPLIYNTLMTFKNYIVFSCSPFSQKWKKDREPRHPFPAKLKSLATFLPLDCPLSYPK